MRRDLRTRKTRTASGATAVQVVRYGDKRRMVVEHIGIACDEDALASLLVLDEVASALDPDTEEAIT
jgi:ABC-type glutathione transport system ATPase component